MAPLHKCMECGFVASKPSHLAQHMAAHSSERPFCCPVDGCTTKCKRRDHLRRHLRTHGGTTLKCPWPNCKLECSNNSNLKRHLRRHNVKGTLQRCRDKSADQIKTHSCECGKQFRYLSAQQRHRETVHDVQYAEIVCSEVGCFETFSDVASLQEHTRVAHKYIVCEVCGKNSLKKNFKRHREAHVGVVGESFCCPHPHCSNIYTRKSNLSMHIKAVHLQMKPYACSFDNCGQRFAFKHVRDNHERTAAHLPWLGDFVSQEQGLLMKSKGGRKQMIFSSAGDLFES